MNNSPRLAPVFHPFVWREHSTLLLYVMIFTKLFPFLPAHALVITDYTPSVNLVFASGFLTEPQRNTSTSFIGAEYDFSGAGWVDGLGTSASGRRMHNVTMVTPLHFAAAKHNVNNFDLPNLGPGVTLSFVSATGELIGKKISSVVSSVPTAGTSNDLAVGLLTSDFAADDQVAIYRVLDVANFNYTGMGLMVYGSQADNTGPRVGMAQVTGSSSSQLFWSSAAASGNARYWEGGDSSSPAFITYQAINGSSELTLAGTAWFPNSMESWLSTASFDPISSVNGVTKATGYAVKLVIYDNPLDPMRTAPLWTGGTGDSKLSTAGNWSSGVSPATLPVVFDGELYSGPTSIALDTNFSLRGALFKDAAANKGFSLSGNGVLGIGYTGIRNESKATQVFNLAIALQGSQNWEATHGGLIFNGPIDTGEGNLVAIGGNQNSVISGVISGAGALAKDDQGLLTLNNVNTYTGKTFLHNGTIRLGPMGNLPVTELEFLGGQTAVLDLNGRDQAFASVTSLYGGTGRILLGGATLSVNPSIMTGTPYSGTIEGYGIAIKGGAGLWVLSGMNTFSGTLRVDSGVLRTGSSGALSSQSNLQINGGLLELGTQNLSIVLGTNAGQLQITGSGGFSAWGGNRQVSLGSGVTWGEGGFVPVGSSFILSSNTADSTIDFQTAINLNVGNRNFFVDNGTARIDAKISGVLSNGGVTKTGVGTLELSGSNTYTGQTNIYGGGLLVTSPTALGNGNVNFNGGILVLGVADFTRSLGTGGGQVQFSGNGGFGAYGADRIVNIGGNSAPLVWGTGNFLANGATFTLSLNSANAMVDIQNPIDFNGATRTVGVSDGLSTVDARLSGVLSNGGLIKTGVGTLELSGANTYTGPTQINAGALKLSSSSALGIGNLVINGGVLLLGSGDFNRVTGSGTEQVQFLASGGFGASGATRTVNLGASVVWGTAGFVPVNSSLILSSSAADATVIFSSSMNLNGGIRTVQANDGLAAVDGQLSGNLTNGGLLKTGAGTLELTGSNTYSSTTTISSGALRLASTGALSVNSNLILSGGVVELASGNFTRSLGAAAGQVQFLGSGGFSAVGGIRLVNLGGAGASVTWGTGNFLPSASTFILSSSSADGTLNFQNNLILGAAGAGSRTIQVDNGSADIDAHLSGVITAVSGVRYNLIKTGDGTLEISGSNSVNGEVKILAGTLLLTGTLANAQFVQVSQGATFSFAGTTALTRRVVLDGGYFSYNSPVSYSGVLEFLSGSVGGSGNLGNTPFSLGSGMVITPGNITGTLTTGSQWWLDGGVYKWEINDLNGIKGGANGWDWLSINGTLSFLDITGEFILKLDSLGALADWNPSSQYSWTIATASGGIHGFDSGKVLVDAGGFSDENPLGSGSFQLAVSGNSLNLNFVPIPESRISTLFLAGIAIGGFLLLFRQRRKNITLNPPYFLQNISLHKNLPSSECSFQKLRPLPRGTLTL